MSNVSASPNQSNQLQHNSNSIKTHTNSNQSPTNPVPTIIKLKKSQRYQHPDKVQTTSQKFSRNLTPKHIILGDYQTFLSQFTHIAASSQPHHSKDLTNPYTEQSKAVLETILNQYNINHAELNSYQQHSVYFAIQTILHNINRALNSIEADQYKTGGAAVRRLSKAIKQYNQSRSNYNLLLSSIRQAISSTVRTRQYIQNTTDNELNYFYTKTGELRSYKSKIFAADYNAIAAVLNPDLYYLYRDYKLTIKLLPKINQIVAKYNLLLSSIDQNTLRRVLQLSNN